MLSETTSLACGIVAHMHWSYPRTIAGLACLAILAVLCAGLAKAVRADGELVAAWLQALGGLAALISTIYFTVKESRRADAAERRAEDAADRAFEAAKAELLRFYRVAQGLTKVGIARVQNPDYTRADHAFRVWQAAMQQLANQIDVLTPVVPHEVRIEFIRASGMFGVASTSDEATIVGPEVQSAALELLRWTSATCRENSEDLVVLKRK